MWFPLSSLSDILPFKFSPVVLTSFACLFTLPMQTDTVKGSIHFRWMCKPRPVISFILITWIQALSVTFTWALQHLTTPFRTHRKRNKARDTRSRKHFCLSAFMFVFLSRFNRRVQACFGCVGVFQTLLLIKWHWESNLYFISDFAAKVIRLKLIMERGFGVSVHMASILSSSCWTNTRE